MKTQTLDILSKGTLADAICFTSNGVLKKNGALVMGAGVAKAFRDRIVGVDIAAGVAVKANGNICQPVLTLSNIDFGTVTIVAFPTKHHWRNDSSIDLIKRSAEQLVELADKNDWKKILLPPPGCGMGNLSFEKDVRPVLEKILDDRFIVSFLQRG